MPEITQTHPCHKSGSDVASAGMASAVKATEQIPGLTSIISNLSVKSVSRYFGGAGYIPDKKTVIRIQHAITDAAALITPTATFTLCPVTGKSSEEKLFLKNDLELSLPSCCVDPGVRFAAAAIGTLGDNLEKKCRDLAQQGRIYQSTLLDAVGTATLDLCGELMSDAIVQSCHQSGLLKGHRFAPGLDGYPLKYQQLLFKIVDNKSIDVFLNSSAIMTPAKSISFFLLLTESRLKIDETSKCRTCRMNKCQYRLKK